MKFTKYYLPMVFVLSGLLLTAGGSNIVPKEVAADPNFFSKMEMIENITSLESIKDDDLKVVINSPGTLPDATLLADDDERSEPGSHPVAPAGLEEKQ